MALDFVFRWLLGTIKEQVAKPGGGKENRSLERFTWNEPTYASLELTSGERGTMRDVSYGSIGASLKAARGGFELAEGRLTARLRILDVSVDCVLKPVRTAYVQGDEYTAFLFLHETTESLIFLRELMEPLRCAHSLAPVSKSVLNDRYKSGDYECWRGDGPTDLVLRMTSDQRAIAELLLTYRAAGDYLELAYKDGKLTTRRSIDDRGVAERMAQTNGLDRATLRHALCLFAGLDDAMRAKLKGVTEACFKELGKKASGTQSAA